VSIYKGIGAAGAAGAAETDGVAIV